MAGGPVGYDNLVVAFESYTNLLCAVPSSGTEVRGFGSSQEDTSDKSLDPADESVDVEREVSNRDFLRLLLANAHTLSCEQRIALFLNLRDGDIRQIAFKGLASRASIASLLEIPDDYLRQIWNQLPLNDDAIAKLLTQKARHRNSVATVTVQQVRNLRAAAQRTLQERLRPFVANDLRRLWLAAIVLEHPRPGVIMLYLRDRHGFSILRMLPRASTSAVKLNPQTISEGLQIDRATLKAWWDRLPLEFEDIRKIVQRQLFDVMALYKDAYDRLKDSLHRLYVEDSPDRALQRIDHGNSAS